MKLLLEIKVAGGQTQSHLSSVSLLTAAIGCPSALPQARLRALEPSDNSGDGVPRCMYTQWLCSMHWTFIHWTLGAKISYSDLVSGDLVKSTQEYTQEDFACRLFCRKPWRRTNVKNVNQCHLHIPSATNVTSYLFSTIWPFIFPLTFLILTQFFS